MQDSSPDPANSARRRGRRARSRKGERTRDPVSYRVEPDPCDGVEEERSEVPPLRVDWALEEERIDSDAAKVVQRLVRHGYEAYLVGGCVRDLLLGRTPKDFDVATSARPDDVRALFRNSRIIGRRFRLVHVLFGGGKVIETATFRRSPAEEGAPAEEDGVNHLLIRDDNVFGKAFEDAARRDFTINALFYDLTQHQVLDWCSGFDDIERRAVRTIGDPAVRFREDPIRMLRAIKFCARLDLGIEPETYRAIVQCRDQITMAAKPRVFEEILRLLRGGAAHRSVWLLWETGLLDALLPELAAYLYDADPVNDRVWLLLDRVDTITREQQEAPDDIVLLALLLLEPMREACDGEADRIAAGHEFLEVLAERLAMPRRIGDSIRRIVAALPRLEADRPGRFARTPLYPLAVEVLTQVRAITPSSKPSADSQPPPRRRRRKR